MNIFHGCSISHERYHHDSTHFSRWNPNFFLVQPPLSIDFPFKKTGWWVKKPWKIMDFVNEKNGWHPFLMKWKNMESHNPVIFETTSPRFCQTSIPSINHPLSHILNGKKCSSHHQINVPQILPTDRIRFLSDGRGFRLGHRKGPRRGVVLRCSFEGRVTQVPLRTFRRDIEWWVDGEFMVSLWWFIYEKWGLNGIYRAFTVSWWGFNGGKRDMDG